MRIGPSLVLIAVGAILKFAVTTPVKGLDVGTVGLILMVIGAVGLLITLVMMNTRRRTDVICRADGTTFIAPAERADPYDPRY